MAATLLSAKKKVLALIELAKMKNINIIEAYIFGSYAKKTNHEHSDIDIALVSEDFKGKFFEDTDLIDDIILKVGYDLEVHPFNPRDFNENNLFVKEILKHAIRVH